MPDLRSDQWVFLEFFNRVDVQVHALVFFHQSQRFLDMTQSALTENIQFIQANVFRYEHINLGGREILRRHMDGRVMKQRRFTDEHATGMYAEVIGKPIHEFAVREDQVVDMIFFFAQGIMGAARFAVVISFFAEVVDFWLANLITSLLFLAVHLPGWIALNTLRADLAATVFVFGLAMGIVFKYADSLLAPIVTHSANDFLSFVVFRR